MFTLQKNNVIKVVEDETSRDKLISKGFKIYLEEVTKDNIEKKEEKIEIVKQNSNDLFNLSKPELIEIAKGKNIKGYSSKSKEELLQILGIQND
ncbi:hypothetical protein IC218_21170 [Clostridioides sp. ES-S-0005-03]|uniref:hypothetical protein n=1 Tax=unclassified Clostridioides TaxID=2635829 RepID=UPI001D130638|nr:hypothetical protein [Clostridioides sp. ES-S-0173-01]MCC0682740.1 hypothetical protein [Clostridioides sp. ES-S-0005-03]UDN49594.1 hypothetical protein JJJ25_19830 [Clostridioides sp. ES-S-0173-01]